jgi:hypothetical protein
LNSTCAAAIAQIALDQKVEGSNPSSPANAHYRIWIPRLTLGQRYVS